VQACKRRKYVKNGVQDRRAELKRRAKIADGVQPHGAYARQKQRKIGLCTPARHYSQSHL